MELYQLKTFVTVAETCNISKAAEILHTSQPAVSAQIKALEDEFGIILFQRTSKGVVLTEQGKKIKDKADKILTAAQDFDYYVHHVKNDPHVKLKIALNTDAGVLKINELLGAAAENHPELEFQFLHSSTAAILSEIQNRRLDGGFFFGEQWNENIAALPLCEIELVIAAPSVWRNKLDDVPLKAILELPWVMPPVNCPFYEKVNGLFQKYSVEPKKFVSSDHETTTLQLVQSGVGISLLPEYMCRRAVERNELVLWAGEKIVTDLSFAYLLKNKESPGLTALRDLLEKVWFE
ncbi:MAG: LysR family transcriptional regulator [Spirochaetales bacterium]|nr:LysR family transcriptional regulator [Spirochaetales bacterium]